MDWGDGQLFFYYIARKPTIEIAAPIRCGPPFLHQYGVRVELEQFNNPQSYTLAGHYVRLRIDVACQ